MVIPAFLLILIVTLAIGVPIAFTLILSSVGIMYVMDMFDTQIIAQQLIEGANNYALMAIPFFMLAGELMNAGGISNRIVNFAMSIVGHIRGGLGYVAIIAGILFAGLSGSAIADIAALGAILIPMMVQRGYDVKISTGLICAAGLIAVILPPSIPMILYGVTSGTSITQLFMAGITPGFIMALSLVIVWTIYARKDKSELPKRKSFKEILEATKDASWALLLPVIIILGLRFGIFTPTEAGVVAAFYALFVGAVVYKTIKIKDIYKSLLNTAKTTSVVMLLVAAAMVAAWFITIANLPREIANLLGPLIDSPMLLLIVVNIMLLLIGMVLDITPAILIFTPVLTPIIQMAGIDPVYFGVLMVLNLTIGMITPPIGVALYVGGSISNLSMSDLVKGIWPFIIAYLIILFLLVLFPQIIMVPLGWLT
jgi:TRAP-type transport system large permease protein